MDVIVSKQGIQHNGGNSEGREEIFEEPCTKVGRMHGKHRHARHGDRTKSRDDSAEGGGFLKASRERYEPRNNGRLQREDLSSGCTFGA